MSTKYEVEETDYLKYEVKKDGDGWWACLKSDPDRKFHSDKSRDAAIGYLMLYVSENFRNGEFNPPKADEKLLDPIQRSMEILLASLTASIEKRAECQGFRDGPSSSKSCCCELIGNLGTAIAALSRIKHD